MVFPSGPPPRSLQIASSTRIALVQWAPGQVPDSSTRFVSLSQTGETDGEFVAQVGPDQRWSYEALDPERAANLAGWAQRTRAVPLPQLVSFPRAHSSVDLKLMPLSPRQITSGGLDTTIETRPYDSQRTDRSYSFFRATSSDEPLEIPSGPPSGRRKITRLARLDRF